MADGKSEDEWSRASLIASLLFNKDRKPNEQKGAEFFNPYHDRRRRKGRRLGKANIADLQVFLR